MLFNRPLNGIYKECRGICRFSSAIPMHSEFQPEDVGQLEFTLSQSLQLSAGVDTDEDEAMVTGQLAAKTLLVLTSLHQGTVLGGLRTEAYLEDAWRVLFSSAVTVKPPVERTARAALAQLHQSITRWFAMSKL